MNRMIVFFDGHCVMCSRTMRFFKRIDKKCQLEFDDRNSEFAAAFRDRTGFDPGKFESVVYVKNFADEGERIFFKSDAALMILKDVGGVWGAISILLYVPKFIRDPIYDFISKNRHRISKNSP